MPSGSYEFPPYKPDSSGFYRDIKEQVGEHFRSTYTNPRDPVGGLWRMALVTAFSLSMFCAAFNPAVGDVTFALPATVAAVLTAVAQVLQLPALYTWAAGVAGDDAMAAALQAASTHVVSFTGIAAFTAADPAAATALASAASVTLPFASSCCLRIVAALLFGICQALPLLHVMHDCSHTSFGPNETWWYIAGRLYLDFYAGCSMTSWHNQHTIGHHIYTNVFQADPDMPKAVDGKNAAVRRACVFYGCSCLPVCRQSWMR